MVQVPAAIPVTMPLEMLQMLAVSDDRLTFKPELAVALQVACAPTAMFNGLQVRVMVWSALVMARFAVTGVAAV
jgi:hypothetical protein